MTCCRFAESFPIVFKGQQLIWYRQRGGVHLTVLYANGGLRAVEAELNKLRRLGVI